MGQFTDSFLRGLFAALGVEDNARNRAFFTSWEPHENTAAAHNPLATTQNAPGATAFNSVGVRNFPDEQTGIAATAETLTNGYYPNVMRFLKGEDVPGTVLAQDISTWGSKGFARELAGGVLPDAGPTPGSQIGTGLEIPPEAAAGSTGAPPGGDAYQDWVIKAGQLYPRWNALVGKMIQAEEAGAVWLPDQGWVSESYSQDPTTGATLVTGQTVWVTPEEYDEFTQLDGQIADLEQDFETQFGAQALNDFITRQDYIWSSDPRNIDADNAATQFKNQFDIITEAAKIAADAFNAQADHYTLAFDSQAAGGARDPQGNFSERNAGRGGPMVGSPAQFVTFEAMFDQALGKLRSELPEVPDRPYYPSGAPPEIRSIGAARQEAIGAGSTATPGGPPAIPSAATPISAAARITGTGRGIARADAAMAATPIAGPPAIPRQTQQSGGGGSFFGHGPSIPGFNIGLSPRDTAQASPAGSPFTGNIIDKVRLGARDVQGIQRIRGSLFR